MTPPRRVMPKPDAMTILPGELSQAERICGDETITSASAGDDRDHVVLPGELSQVEPVCGDETLTGVGEGSDPHQILPGELSQIDPL